MFITTDKCYYLQSKKLLCVMHSGKCRDSWLFRVLKKQGIPVCSVLNKMSIFHFFIITFYCVYVSWCICGGQRMTCRRWFSPSTIWVPGNKLRSSLPPKRPHLLIVPHPLGPIFFQTTTVPICNSCVISKR